MATSASMGAHRPHTTATLRAHGADRRDHLLRELRQVVRRRVDADVVGADTTRNSAQRANDSSTQRIDDSIVQRADDSSDHPPQALLRELRQVVLRRVDADIVGADTTRESAQRANDSSAQRIDDSIVQRADDSSNHPPQADAGNGGALLHLPLPLLSPADEDESERRFGACCVCMSRGAGVAFIDCGHLCTCVKCALKLHARKDKCPLCRRPIKAILRVWAGCEVAA